MNTINDLIKYLETIPNNPKALNFKTVGNWTSISKEDYLRQILSIASGLKTMGLKKGDKVAIMSPPSPYWTICDLGIMLMGCVSVPIYDSLSEDHFVYQIVNTETKVIFVSGKRSHDICQKHSNLFKHTISIDDKTEFPKELLYKDFISQEFINIGSIEQYVNDPEDLASIVYTSGVTSEPKGVELTHKNMVCELIHGIERLQLIDQDRYLHFLPLAHIYGRILNLTFLMGNATIYYVEEVSKLFEESRWIKPTLIVLLPRMIEKIFNSISHKIEMDTFLKKALTKWAFTLADKSKTSGWFPLLYPFLNWILYRKIRRIYGGSLRLIMTGGSKVNSRFVHFFNHIGLPIIDGYGLTEACPAITNSIKDNITGTIGKPMPEVEVKIAENGEILLRGPIVMRGYYKNSDLNREVVDSQGWFHTGDLGSMTAQGYVKYDRRLGETCKTSYGELVNPPLLEEKLNQFSFVDASVVIAEDRPYVTCLFFVDSDALALLKKRLALTALSDEEIVRIDLIKKEFERNLKNLNEHFDKAEQIRDYRFIFHKIAIEEGELTPSMKIRRHYIESKYQALIDEMYPQKETPIDL